MFDTLTSAQVGSAVRWIITTVGSSGALAAYTQGLDWVALAAAGATMAQLLWSFWANKKKVAA